MKFFKKSKKFSLMLILALCFTMLCAEPAMAATKSLKSQKFTTTLATIQKKGTLVKRGANYTLKVKSSGGWIKFKAPATKLYTFNFSGMTSSKNYTCGHISLNKTYSQKYVTNVKVRTQGGTTGALYVANRKGSVVYKKATENYLTSRYAKLKLKKGESVYIYLWATSPFSIRFSVK